MYRMMTSYGIQTRKKEFRVEKSSFHKTLINTFSEGLGLPDSVSVKLEGFLNKIKETIAVSSKSGNSDTDLTLSFL
jgi:hypothetical protein